MFGRFCYALIINSGDRRTESREFFDKLFISAFDVINLRNLRRALRDKSRQHHRRACAQVCRHNLAAAQSGVASDNCLVSGRLDIGTHLIELGHMHEAIFKYRLDNCAGTLDCRQKRHEW